VLSVTVLTLLGKYHGAAGGAQTFCACWLPPEGVPRGGATGSVWNLSTGKGGVCFLCFLSWVWVPPFSADIREAARRGFGGRRLAGLPPLRFVYVHCLGLSHHTRGRRASSPRPSFWVLALSKASGVLFWRGARHDTINGIPSRVFWGVLPLGNTRERDGAFFWMEEGGESAAL
jgi:hypothetical protein